MKSDQEPSMVILQVAIQEIKPEVIPTNSSVGESESNGWAENAITRVQEKIRVLRHQIEQNTKETIDDNAPIMAWLVRWSAEFISKYAPGNHGRTAYERIWNEQCKVLLVPFGETVMYLPMKTAHSSNGEPAKKLGLWFGTIERTEETIIGTQRGVIKCRIVSRLAEGDRWNKEMINGMPGLPWQPVPNRHGQHIPVEIDENGEVPGEVEENEKPPKEDTGVDEEDLGYQKKVHGLHVSRKAIANYGVIEGCPACNAINKRGHLTGRIGYNHNTTCRTRILQVMRDDTEYRRLVHKHETHQQAGDVEVFIEAQMSERKHNLQKARQLSHTLFHNLLMQMEVAEVYIPPRVTKMAEQLGLRAGWASDLTTHDDDGRAWDFDQLEVRNRALRKLLRDEPTLLIGSPMCTAFSQMNHINYSRMDPMEVKTRTEHGRRHFEFCTRLYDMQWSAGRYLLHEHLAGASSWSEPCMTMLMKKHGVVRANGDQCQYGLTTTANGITWLARKSIGFITNWPCIAKLLNKRCPNRSGWQVHRHIRLESGRTNVAHVYPPELCAAICNGFSEQLQVDRDGQFLLASVGTAGATSSGELRRTAEEFKRRYKTVEEDLGEQFEEAWGDVSGAQLDPKGS